MPGIWNATDAVVLCRWLSESILLPFSKAGDHLPPPCKPAALFVIKAARQTMFIGNLLHHWNEKVIEWLILHPLLCWFFLFLLLPSSFFLLFFVDLFARLLTCNEPLAFCSIVAVVPLTSGGGCGICNRYKGRRQPHDALRVADMTQHAGL